MKSGIVFFKTIVFMITAYILYAQAAESIRYRISFDLLTPADAYTIWRLIEKLENKWLTNYDPHNKIPLDNKSKAIIENLHALSKQELELSPLIHELEQARINNEIIRFLQKKEKIANILRPLWRKAILEEQAKKRKKLSWRQWAQEKIRFIKDFLYRRIFFSSH